jgi:predicted dehydrogenase
MLAGSTPTSTARPWKKISSGHSCTASGLEQIPVEHRPMPAQFGAELASFAKSIREGTEVEVPGEIGRHALHAILSVYESMKTGGRVVL